MSIKKIISTIFIATLLTGTVYAEEPDWKLIEEEYCVRQEETLDSIALKFMEKNTYGKREINEFKSGIVELNPWLLERDLKCGDIIRINYWVKKEK